MYKCLECGNIFEQGEEKKWTEPHDEKMKGCPVCNGAYEETKKCAICNSEHLESELHNDICNDCLSKHYNDVDICYKIGKSEKVDVTLNVFLAEVFKPEDIENILYNFLKNSTEKDICKEFINSDIDWFSEKLYDEVVKK